jgi:hypothetical protein
MQPFHVTPSNSALLQAAAAIAVMSFPIKVRPVASLSVTIR